MSAMTLTLRRVALTIGAALGILMMATVVSLIGIQLAGSIGAWHRWLGRHWPHFLLWRLCLYGVAIYAWWRMRKRLPLHARTRMRRAEIAALCTLILLEAITWIQHDN